MKLVNLYANLGTYLAPLLIFCGASPLKAFIVSLGETPATMSSGEHVGIMATVISAGPATGPTPKIEWSILENNVPLANGGGGPLLFHGGVHVTFLPPISDRARGSSESCCIRFASSSRLPGSKAKPFTPSATRSGTQPHCRETSTGKPAAIASLTTRTHGSLTLASTNASAVTA